MGKKRPTSILKRAGAQEPRSGKKQKTAAGASPRNGHSQPAQRRQQHEQGGGGSGSRRQSQQQPAGLRPVSAVHTQAAYAVRRLLEADTSKRGGATLKSLTLGNDWVAAKDKKVQAVEGSAAGVAACWSVECCITTHIPTLAATHAVEPATH